MRLSLDLQAGLAGVVAGLVAWYGLFAWDTQLSVSPTGQLQFPYDWWQIVLALGLAWGGAALFVFRHRFAIAVTYCLAFTAAFAAGRGIYAAHTDVTGTWGAGLFVVVIGLLLVTLVFSALVAALKWLLLRRRG